MARTKKSGAGSRLEPSSTPEGGTVQLITRYAQTFLWLQSYDEGLLVDPVGQKGGVLPSIQDVRAAIAALRAELMAHGEAGPLFGQEREDGLASILGNLDQSVFGQPAYPTIESKAAHLLYFVIKDHPLSDGNKRSGALLFVDFLHRNGRLLRDGEPVVNDVGLAALALLVAQSAPRDKDVLIRLIINMLAQADAAGSPAPDADASGPALLGQTKASSRQTR